MRSKDFYSAVKEYQELKNIPLRDALKMLSWYDGVNPCNLQHRNWKNVGYSYASWRIFLKFGKDMPKYGSTEWHNESKIVG